MKSISAIEAKFLRLNINTPSTKLFTEISTENKMVIQENVQFLEHEEMILCYFPRISYWWGITNCRLILSEDGQTRGIFLSDIESVEPKDIFNNEISKQSCKHLDFKTHHEYVKLEVEEGTWHAIYNIMKFAIN